MQADLETKKTDHPFFLSYSLQATFTDFLFSLTLKYLPYSQMEAKWEK